MSENARLREIRRNLDAVAPVPAGAPVRASDLARHLAVRAQERYTRLLTPFAGTDAAADHQQAAVMLAEFAAAHALYALAEAEDAPGYSSHIATQIRDAWDDGGAVGEWLWQHLGAGTATEVAALAEELAGAAPQAAAPDETETLRSACRTLGTVTAGLSRTLKAAWIELAQGYPVSAREWIAVEVEDCWDGDEWDGSESAQEWFSRTAARGGEGATR